MNNKVFYLILQLAKLLMESGAEVYRVEESISRMCAAYGILSAEVYATTSNIIVSIPIENEMITHTCRIRRMSNNIEQVTQLNALVREISNTAPDADTISTRLEQIRTVPQYPTPVIIFFYGFIAAAFCLFFGSRSAVETVLAFFIGICVGLCSYLFDLTEMNRMFSRFGCSFLASVLAYTAFRCSLIQNVDYIIIGNIMTLIPGIGLTNGLRDLFVGDNISGFLRTMEAVLLAFSIAAGYILVRLLFGGFFA